jgi:NADH:ubiquinone oxidoreductase subunit 6 (subunit J)
MDAKTGFFYLFSVVLLFAAFRVITARNPVHAVLYLMLAFSQAPACGCCSRPSSWPSRWCWCTWAR